MEYGDMLMMLLRVRMEDSWKAFTKNSMQRHMHSQLTDATHIQRRYSTDTASCIFDQEGPCFAHNTKLFGHLGIASLFSLPLRAVLNGFCWQKRIHP